MGFFSPPRLEKTVIIIGGGPAGTKLAVALDPKVNVIMIERRSTYVHCVAGLRACVSPSEGNVVIPYGSLLKSGRVVTGEVVALKEGGVGGGWTVVLDSGEEIKGDAVALATGSGQNQLGRTGALSTPEEIKGYFKSIQDKVSRASKIVVVGGGPVGIEMVGELKHFHPKIDVTLVHNGESLVSNAANMANPKFKKSMLSIIEKSGAKVLLNDSIAKSLFKDNEWIVEGPLDITTAKGVKLPAVDLLFKAVGVPLPTGRILSSPCFEKALDKDGYFIVDEHYQVAGRPGLFALGTCLHPPPALLACKTSNVTFFRPLFSLAPPPSPLPLPSRRLPHVPFGGEDDRTSNPHPHSSRAPPPKKLTPLPTPSTLVF